MDTTTAAEDTTTAAVGAMIAPDLLRRLPTLTREAFDAAVAAAMDAITVDDIRGWIAFAGYKLDSI